MTDPAPHPPAYIAHPQGLKRLTKPMLLLLVALFLFSMAVNTIGNRFPYFYHADEPGKVKQIIQEERNFNHPLLMLEMAQGVSGLLHTKEPQAIVEVGRWLSAFYLAITTLCVAWLIWQWWGAWAATAAGGLFAIAPDVIELSHFFKEDAALAMGVGLFFLGALLWEARGHWQRLVLFGVLTGICASAKYVGFAALPLGLALLWWRSFNLRHHTPEGHWRRLLGQGGIYLLAAIVAFSAMNSPMIRHWSEVRTSFQRETKLVAEGQGKMRKKTPHTGFIERFVSRSGALLPFYIVGCWGFWHGGRRRKRWRTEWLYLAFPLLLTLLLSFSAKDSGRYFLPAILGLTSTGAVGLVLAFQVIWGSKWKFRHGLAILLLVLILPFPLERASVYLLGFVNDSRRDLLRFLDGQTPPDAVILQGDRIYLPAPDHRYANAWHTKAPREIRTTKSVADQAETPEQLRGQGITYVALNYSEYSRYLKDGQRPSDDSVEEYNRRRAFYQRLFAEGKLVWESKEAKIGPNNPALRLYELPKPVNAN